METISESGRQQNNGVVAGAWESYYLGNSRYDVRCRMRTASTAEVSVRNRSSRRIDASGLWYVEYFDQSDRELTRSSKSENSLRVFEGETKRFTVYGAPFRSSSCRAYLGRRRS